MQIESHPIRAVDDRAESIAATFTQWVQAHRAYGGDFDESALSAGIQAASAAYGGGLAVDQAFEMGRQAYYAALS